MTVELNKSQKFVQILSELQQPTGIRADELMARYDLDDRTLRRYLSDLRSIDVPIQDDGRGTDRVLSLDPSYGRKGVQLTLLELVSLRFGRSLFDGVRHQLRKGRPPLQCAGDGRACDEIDAAYERVSSAERPPW